MITMVRYASYEHYQAMRPGEAVFMGGLPESYQLR